MRVLIPVGGQLPSARRGQVESGLVTGWDWYATYVHGIAGSDPTDHKAEAAGSSHPRGLASLACILL